MAKLRGEKKKKKMHFFSGLKNNNILDNYIIDIFQYLPRFFKGFFLDFTGFSFATFLD